MIRVAQEVVLGTKRFRRVLAVVLLKPVGHNRVGLPVATEGEFHHLGRREGDRI